MAYKLAGNALDVLLGLNPGAPGAPEKIWKAVSERFRELENEDHTSSPVHLTFRVTEGGDDWGVDNRVLIIYDSDGEWDLEKLKGDCAALARLGFNTLNEHGS
jgi:hypothetical protein